MDTNTLIQLATLISVIPAVIGLMISVRAYKRQVSALFLLEYTDRVFCRYVERAQQASDVKARSADARANESFESIGP
jgi:hypothetical protein